MAESKSRVIANGQSAFRLKAEREARMVVSEAEGAADLKAAARAKAKEDAEIWVAAAKAAAKAREEAIAAEEARIDATGKDEWFYLQDGEQSGPLSLVELRGKISDASIEPPINMVWTEGMDGWKPVYKVRRVCEPIASREVETDQGTGKPERPQSEGIAGVKAAAEAQVEAAKAEEEARLRMAAEAHAKAAKAQEEANLRVAAEVKAAEGVKLRMAAEAKAAAAKAEEETRFRMAAEARAAEAKAAEETRLRALAEARAAEEANLRAAAEAKAAEEARLRMAAEVQAAEAKAAEEARLRMAAETKAAEAKAAEEVKLRMAAEAKLAEAKAEEETRLRMAAEAKAAEAKAAEEVKLRMAAEAKVAAEARLRALAEAKAAEEANLRAATEAKAAQEVKLRMAAEAKAAAETRLRALAEARAAEEARFAVAAKSKAEKEARAKAAKEARRLAAAEAKAVKKAGPAGAAATNVWFYTCEGERQGPVAFEELRAMAACSSLDPRLDLVWNSDMDTWKPAGQIDGLFQQRTLHVETNRKPARSAISRRSPQRCSRTQNGGIIPWPGVRRRTLLLVTLIFPFSWQFALGAISPFLVKEFGQVHMGRILPVAALVPLVVLVHFGLRRLVNLGMSRWWYLAVFAPIVNLWLGYRCFACPPGYASHKKMDAPGIALAIPYWLIMLAGVVTLASNPARFYGMIDSPKLQKQIHTVIRIASSPGRLLRD